MRQLLLAAYCLALSTSTVFAADGVGVLILAHGGSGRWNQLVTETVAKANLSEPTQIAFGMGMHPQEVRAIQQAVDELQQHHVSRIVVVPLLISSSSEVMRQFEYLLRLRDHGPWEAHVKPVTVRLPITMTQPLDDDPVVSDVLLERAQRLSQIPEQEAVVVVAHGPTTDEDNVRWLEVMQRLAARMKEQGHFRAVMPVTMRDDAPTPVQEQATRQMRELVRQSSTQGRTLVVPLLLATGGIEDKIPKRLHGLIYTYQATALLPHPKLSQWIASRVRLSSAEPSVMIQ